MPSQLPRSRTQIDFVPKVRLPREKRSHASLRKNSLAACKSTIPVAPPKEALSHGLQYFPLWLAAKALWFGMDLCLNQAFDGLEAIARLRRNGIRDQEMDYLADTN